MGKHHKKKEQPIAKPVATTVPSPKKPNHVWRWLIGIVVITFLCYTPMLSGQKEFTNWDDPGYITEQPLLKSLSAENIKAIFDRNSVVQFNYHPLTILSLAIDYQSAYDPDTNELSIAPFVRTNLILHLLNTVLVFIFLYQLSKRRLWLAGLAALLFGIHPMHVESVAWLSERKDVLYCFFFLLSCICYYNYIETDKKWMLGLSFVCFLASCLSKAMAVPLPLVLVLIDYYHKRKATLRTWLEKLPFALVAAVIGYYTLLVQKEAIMDQYALWQRICFACYGFWMYLFKFIIPINLSAYYPYPLLENISVIYYISPLIVLVIAIAIIYFIRKKFTKENELIFGIGFYFFMVALVLHVMTVGGIIIADRYTYLAYIGPVFFVSALLNDYLVNEKTRKKVLVVLVPILAIFAIITFNRIKIWNNSRSLWTDVLEKHAHAKAAYKNLGDYYADNKIYDSAFLYYHKAIEIGAADAGVWSNISNIYLMRNQLPEAENALTESIKIDTTNYETYMKRAVVFQKLGKDDSAIIDANKVMSLEPTEADAYSFEVKIYLGKENYKQAIAVANEGIARLPKNDELYFFRGIAYTQLADYTNGISDLQHAISLNPNSGLYYYNLASAYQKAGNKPEALKAGQKALELRFPVSPDFIKKVSQ